MEALSAVVAAPALEEISVEDTILSTYIRNGMMIADMFLSHVIFRSVGVRLYGMGEEISAKREIAGEDDSEIKFAYTEFFGNLFYRLSTMNNETSHIEEIQFLLIGEQGILDINYIIPLGEKRGPVKEELAFDIVSSNCMGDEGKVVKKVYISIWDTIVEILSVNLAKIKCPTLGICPYIANICIMIITFGHIKVFEDGEFEMLELRDIGEPSAVNGSGVVKIFHD